MADVSFHHGVRVSESAETPVLIRTVQSAVICLLGTAPDADATAFPLNTPVLLKGAQDAATAALLGADGTLKDAYDAVMDQIGAYTYVIRVEEGEDLAETLSNLVGDVTSMTGVHAIRKIEPMFGRKLKARLIAAPGYTGALATDGVSAVTIGDGGEGYSANASITVAGDGSGAELEPIITAGVITGVVIKKPGSGYSAAPTLTVVDDDGADAVLTATVGTVGNPVVHELVGILEETRAVAFIDGPASADAAAVAAAGQYSSDRLYVCEPMAQVWDTEADGYVSQPLSARLAGVQAKVDRTQGFAHSVSNKTINGVDGVSRPISYGPQTDYLNENKVNTLINRGDGWRTWGNRSTTGVSLWRYLNVRRCADFINEALEEALFEFVDTLPTSANLKFMIQSAQAFLDSMVNEGYIIGGKVWLDPAKNASTETAQGRWTLSVKFEPYAPMEDIRAITHRDITYYDLLLDDVNQSIQDGALAIADAA